MLASLITKRRFCNDSKNVGVEVFLNLRQKSVSFILEVESSHATKTKGQMEGGHQATAQSCVSRSGHLEGIQTLMYHLPKQTVRSDRPEWVHR